MNTSKNLASLIGATTAAALVAVALSGCATHTAAPVGIAIVAGERANTPAPDAAAIKAAIPSSLPVGSTITLTGVSGSVAGQPGMTGTVVDAGEKFANEEAALGVRARVLSALPKVAATAPQADDLSAVAAAAATIKSIAGSRTVIIADSMLSTSGILDFTKGLLGQNPAQVAAKVPSAQLPDLHGDRVLILGQGAVALPQPPLGTADRNALREIWAKVLTRAGAASIRYVDSVQAGPAVQSAPAVSTVTPSPVAPIQFAKCSAIAGADTLSFMQGSAKFVDPQAASATIHDIVTHLAGCTGTVLVEGTTSSEGTAVQNVELSKERAQLVAKAISADTGIPVSTMTVKGLGSKFPGAVKDTDANGKLIEAQAQKNRTVRVRIGAKP